LPLGERCYFDQPEEDCKVGHCDESTLKCVADSPSNPGTKTGAKIPGAPGATKGGTGGGAGGSPGGGAAGTGAGGAVGTGKNGGVTNGGVNSVGGGSAGAANCDPNIKGLCVPKSPFSGGLAGTSTLYDLISQVIKYLLYLAGIVAIIFIIIGGYQYVTSAGSEEGSEKGKKTLINAVIGLVVVVLAFALVSILSNLLTSGGIGGSGGGSSSGSGNSNNNSSSNSSSPSRPLPVNSDGTPIN
jgi:hypothetical protein